MKKAFWAIAVLSAVSFVSCSENLDSNHSSPVLDRDQEVHKPGNNAAAPDSDSNDSDAKGDSGDEADGGGDAKTDGDSTITINPVPDTDAGESKEDDAKDDDDEPEVPVNPTPNLPDKDPDIADDSAVDGGYAIVGGESYPIQSLTYAPYTTLQRRHKPTIGTQRYTPGEVFELILAGDFKATDKKLYSRYGMGTVYAEGQPWIVQNKLLRTTDPAISRKGKSLAYFWQISDPQIVDAQSPCRMEAVTRTPYVLASAYRAQGIYSTHMFDLHVQTARRISDYSSRPFDFALVTGDVADNAQTNEFDWFDRMMTGGVVEPDSGDRDDPVPGPGNDFTDPYYARGLGNIPWYVAIGNHDMLYMGFTPITDKHRQACTGDTVVDLFEEFRIVASAQYRDGYNNGFQDASDPDSPVRGFGAKTAPDANRMPLSKAESLQKFYNAGGTPAGHGLELDTIAKGWGYYATYPIPGKPIKLITLDTNSGSFSEADMTPDQYRWLESQLETAKSNRELVILQSHHGTSQLSGSIKASDFRKLVAKYENVIIHITGHGHYNDSSVHISNNRGYWEVMLASVVDFPSQSRIFEIVYEGNGIIDIYLTNIEPNAPIGSFADTGVRYAATRKFFAVGASAKMTPEQQAAQIVDDMEAQNAHMNLILRTRVSKDIYENIEKYEWSDIIESEVLLNKFDFKASM